MPWKQPWMRITLELFPNTQQFPAHLRPHEDTNASKPKRDEPWTERVSVCVIDRYPEITGEHRCSESGKKPNRRFPIVCRCICWGLSSVSVKIEMQQTPSACTFTSNELSLLELWMLVSLLPSLYFSKWMTQELWGFRQNEQPDFPWNEPY